MTKLLDMLNNRFNDNLPESVRSSLEVRQKVYLKALKALVSMHEVYEEVIKAHRPAEDQENIEHIQSFIERENNILRES